MVSQAKKKCELPRFLKFKEKVGDGENVLVFPFNLAVQALTSKTIYNAHSHPVALPT